MTEVWTLPEKRNVGGKNLQNLNNFEKLKKIPFADIIFFLIELLKNLSREKTACIFVLQKVVKNQILSSRVSCTKFSGEKNTVPFVVPSRFF